MMLITLFSVIFWSQVDLIMWYPRVWLDFRLGYKHTAFSFSAESAVNEVRIDPATVKPGTLISYLQKGLQYAEVESHILEVCRIDEEKISGSVPYVKLRTGPRSSVVSRSLS